MATEAKLRQLADKGCPVYYFYSTERYLVRQAVNAAVRILSADSDEDATVLDGAAPEIEGLIMAAGTISFFGTRRVVVLPEVDPGAYGAKDLDELCSTLASLENAVVVLGSVFPLERSKLKAGKSAQKLIAQCKAIGYVEELAKPRPFELKAMMIDRAKAQGTSLPDGAAAALLERCGEDPFLLENEVDKLCALSGYQTVTAAMVADMGTVSLEADVFEMIRMITAKNATGACKKLQTLLRLQQEPIAITAAMIGSYVDLYRVKLGAARKKNYSTVFKDFGYKGSDYRLKRSAETASHYTLGQIEACLQVLLELDQSLKSQPVEEQILLETALCAPDRCHDPADGWIWHLQRQKAPAAVQSAGAEKRADPADGFGCGGLPHPELHHESGGRKERGAGLCARHSWQGKAQGAARQGRFAGGGRCGGCHRSAGSAGCPRG